ncbi:MAG: response regulator [Spirochaetaceae bacterium]|nr:MAG: response regulator [Spirochaetaceae bacterium]
MPHKNKEHVLDTPSYGNDALLKLALAIGPSRQQQELLAHALPVFLEVLSCDYVGVVANCEDPRLQMLHSAKSLSCRAAASMLKELSTILCSPNTTSHVRLEESRSADTTLVSAEHDDHSAQEFACAEPPVEAFRLAGYGFLFLGRETALGPQLVEQLLPIIDKLAEACRIAHELSVGELDGSALRTQKSHFESIFTNTNDAMVFFDTNSCIVNINTRFTSMFGYELEEVAGKPINTVVDPKKREVVYGDRLILNRETVELEVIRYTKSGKAIQVLLKGGPVIVDDVVTGGYAIYADITKRKHDEELLLRAKLSAEAASKAKSEFLANMSHEIRTPLNGVVSMLSMIEDTPLSRAQHEYIDMATASAETLIAVINDILDFSRIEAGRLELSPRECNMERELHLVMSILSARGREKEIEMLTYYDVAAPLLFMADDLRLRQILFNLAGNAVKFTDKGHILLSVKLKRMDAAGKNARLLFSVKDTGIGIPKSKLTDIFEHFTQVDYSSTRKVGGTGLGLAIARRLVEIMGGELKVKSREDAGSEFSFELELPVLESTGEDHLVPRYAGLHALVVDDNTVGARILTEYLRSWGMKVVTAANATQALRTLNEYEAAGTRLDIALIDYLMPDMDGIDLAAKIIIQDRWASLPLIAVSSHWTHEDSQRLKDAGFHGFVPKPVSRSSLDLSIQECIVGKSKNTDVQAIAPGASKDHKESTTGKEAAPGTLPAGHHGLRVLVAEDNEVNRKSTQMMLEDIATTILTADNGQQALQLFKSEHFDIVLMDIQMPVMDGLETTRHMRLHEAKLNAKPVPIIALTANVMSRDKDTCMSAGMSDYLAKPLRKHDLRAIIEKHLPGRVVFSGTTSAATIHTMNESQTNEIPDHEVKIFDRRDFAERHDNNLAFAAEIMSDALKRYPSELLFLRRAVEHGESDIAKRAAHKIKGTAANLGANRISALCTEIMRVTEGHNGSLDLMQELRQLDSEFDLFSAEAKAWFRNFEINL